MIIDAIAEISIQKDIVQSPTTLFSAWEHPKKITLKM
jgi:hypothetical protein